LDDETLSQGFPPEASIPWGNEAEIFIIAILRGKNNFLYNIDRHTSLGFTVKIGRNAKFRARIGGNAKFFVVKLKIRN